MFDKDLIKNFIDNGVECEYLDFKRDIYDFSNRDIKEHFIVDIMSFANAHSCDDKYIITGVKLNKDGTKEFKSIDNSKIQDGSNYQSLITNNIEPTVIIKFDVVEIKGIQFGIFKIGKENRDRPYCLSKQYRKLQKGSTRIRKGEQNVKVLRSDFDLIYNEKQKSNKSNIKIRGLINGNKTNSFKLKKYESIFNNSNFPNFIKKQIDEINSIVLSKRNNGTYVVGDYVTIKENEKKITKYYAKENKINLVDDFFSLGNLTCFNMPLIASTYNGTDDEKRKYNLVQNLAEYIIDYLSKEKFTKEVSSLYYTNLVIENVGKVFDEDIEVSLSIPKQSFLEIRKFPVPYGDLIDEVLDNNILNDLLSFDKYKNVNKYREKEIRIPPSPPISYKLPIGGWSSPDFESKKEYYYELIEYESDYEVIEAEEEIIFKYIQKDINPNETISFPSKIIFTTPIDEIEYTIKTKHNHNIMSGAIKRI